MKIIRQRDQFKMFKYLTMLFLAILISGGSCLQAAMIPVTNEKFIAGLSPYNWVSKDGFISSSVNGASITLGFKGANKVAFATTDGQHPSVAGHQTIYEKALPALGTIVGGMAPANRAK